MMFRLLSLLFWPVRKALRVSILAYDRLSPPRLEVSRDPAQQQEVDRESKTLVLYHFEACPFCVKVRRHIRRLGLQVELRDTRTNPEFKRELLDGGGDDQVPCLRIPDPSASGGYRWMYESSDINAYLSQRFAG